MGEFIPVAMMVQSTLQSNMKAKAEARAQAEVQAQQRAALDRDYAQAEQERQDKLKRSQAAQRAAFAAAGISGDGSGAAAMNSLLTDSEQERSQLAASYQDRLNSLDASNVNPFESGQRNVYQASTEMSVYINSYTVADSGYVNFPLVGKIQVAGLNINEIKTLFQNTINDYFQMTIVTVKLVNFKVSILGEVVRPGTYLVYQENINILQAISMAGDLSPYAKRNNIIIIRKTATGSSVYSINLLKANIFESPAYFLQPGDIVYVEPMTSKNFAFTAFPYTLIFATITTTLLIMTYIK